MLLTLEHSEEHHHVGGNPVFHHRVGGIDVARHRVGGDVDRNLDDENWAFDAVDDHEPVDNAAGRAMVIDVGRASVIDDDWKPAAVDDDRASDVDDVVGYVPAAAVDLTSAVDVFRTPGLNVDHGLYLQPIATLIVERGSVNSLLVEWDDRYCDQP